MVVAFPICSILGKSIRAFSGPWVSTFPSESFHTRESPAEGTIEITTSILEGSDALTTGTSEQQVVTYSVPSEVNLFKDLKHIATQLIELVGSKGWEKMGTMDSEVLVTQIA